MNYLEVALRDGSSFIGTIVLILAIGFTVAFCISLVLTGKKKL